MPIPPFLRPINLGVETMLIFSSIRPINLGLETMPISSSIRPKSRPGNYAYLLSSNCPPVCVCVCVDDGRESPVKCDSALQAEEPRAVSRDLFTFIHLD